MHLIIRMTCMGIRNMRCYSTIYFHVLSILDLSSHPLIIYFFIEWVEILWDNEDIATELIASSTQPPPPARSRCPYVIV